MNKETADFINHHKISPEVLFDAKGQIISQIKDEMKTKQKVFAYNAKPCSRGNHTLRDRYNHCVICNPAYITFAKRATVVGYIYIAGSIKQKLIKVGMTTENPGTRQIKLNSRKIGDTNDWIMLKAIKCNETNKVELRIHKELSKYKADGYYAR